MSRQQDNQQCLHQPFAYQVGLKGEWTCGQLLSTLGFCLLENRARIGGTEIDWLVEKTGKIWAVEVKTSLRSVLTISPWQLAKIKRGLWQFCMRRNKIFGGVLLAKINLQRPAKIDLEQVAIF